MTRFAVAAVAGCVIFMAGCAATKQAKTVQTNGFLAPYKSLLQKGHRGQEALLGYRNPKANWTSYHKILLEPVLLWNDPNSDLSAGQRKDLQTLVNSFYATLYDKLSRDYTMVRAPGPGVMQIQVAVSHGEPSHTALALASKVILPVKLANSTWAFVGGKPFFTGQVTIEAVVKDDGTGEVLGVGADRRVGGLKLFEKNAFSSWGDVKNSLNFYAAAAVWRLCVMRAAPIASSPRRDIVRTGSGDIPIKRIVLVAGLLPFLAVACGKSNNAGEAVVRPVQTMVVGQFESTVGATYSGQIQARFDSQRGFQVGSTVAKRITEVGEHVKVGVKSTQDVLNAEQTYYQTLEQLDQARYQYLMSVISLQLLVGQLNEAAVAQVDTRLHGT